MNYMFQPLKKYADFSGRARRKEFWLFFVLYLILATIARFVDQSMGYGTTETLQAANGLHAGFHANGPVTSLLALAMLIPNLAVAVRRLHDTDRSGWWLLLIFLPILGWIALLVFYCLRGTQGSNRYGNDPVAEDGDI